MERVVVAAVLTACAAAIVAFAAPRAERRAAPASVQRPAAPDTTPPDTAIVGPPPPQSLIDSVARTTDEDGQPDTLPTLPAGVTLAMLRQGDVLFHGKGRCFACHGAEATGMVNAGSSLTTGTLFVAESWRAIDSLITVGMPDAVSRSPIAMPPRGGRGDLGDREIAAIAAYVWAISQTKGEPWPGGHLAHPWLGAQFERPPRTDGP